jgi:hypothetical protein
VTAAMASMSSEDCPTCRVQRKVEIAEAVELDQWVLSKFNELRDEQFLGHFGSTPPTGILGEGGITVPAFAKTNYRIWVDTQRRIALEERGLKITRSYGRPVISEDELNGRNRD